MSGRITVSSYQKTSPACPAQWQAATDDGRTIYVRYRWGTLTVQIGDSLDDALDQEPIITCESGDGMDGWMVYDRMVELTKNLIDWPEQTSTEYASLDDIPGGRERLEKLFSSSVVQIIGERANACRVCGCTEEDCPESCYLLEPDLCSSCAVIAEEAMP